MAIKGQCAICQHPRVAEITASLNLIGHRPTARKFQVTYSAIDRHKRHLMLEQKLREENQTPRSSRDAIDKLTPQQARFVEGVVVDRKTRRQAALAAGYSDNAARHAGVLMSRPSVRAAFAALLPTPEKCAKRISECLDATKFVEKTRGKPAEVPDFAERRRTAELVLRLRELMPDAANSNLVQVGVQVNVAAEQTGEPNLDLEVARLVAAATDNFNEETIGRLKSLLAVENPAVN